MASDDFDMQVLVKALASLRNPNGTLQESNRKLALGALFSELTESEIIDLRLRLDAIRRPGFSERLQAEIYYKILNYLSLEDAMNLRLVRLDWSKKFSSTEFCKEIVKRHFPAKYKSCEKNFRSFTEDRGEESSSQRQAAAETALESWLENVMFYRRRRARGQYESMSVYYSSDRIDQPQYCNGRIAYVVQREILVVKSLKSDLEERFAIPQRDYFRAWWLSDQYILAINGDGRTIFAWPLERPESQFRDDPQMQHFPNAISDVTARDNRAGLVLCNNETYIWHIEQLKNPSFKVEYPSESGLFPKFHRRQLSVLLHPVKKNVFFVCTERFNDTPDPQSPKHLRTRLRFYEYEDLNRKSRYTLYMNSTRSKTDAQTGPVISILHDNVVGISDLCGFRQYVSDKESSIVHMDMEMDDTNNYLQDIVDEFGPMNGSESDDVLFGRERSVLLFDMDTKAFQCRNYYEPGEEFSTYVGESRPESFIWRDQTLSPIYRPDLIAECPPEGISDVLVTATNHFQMIPNPADGKLYWFSEDENAQTTMQHSSPSQTSPKQNTAFHLVGPPNLAQEARLTSTAEARHVTWEINFEIRRVRGDDNFIVLFGRTGFVVWCFDPDIRLRVKDSDGDKKLSKDCRRNPFEPLKPQSFQFCEQIRDEP